MTVVALVAGATRGAGRAIAVELARGRLSTSTPPVEQRERWNLFCRTHLSEHMVQDHLKSAFAKTGVRSRRELLALARGA